MRFFCRSLSGGEAAIHRAPYSSRVSPGRWSTITLPSLTITYGSSFWRFPFMTFPACLGVKALARPTVIKCEVGLPLARQR